MSWYYIQNGDPRTRGDRRTGINMLERSPSSRLHHPQGKDKDSLQPGHPDHLDDGPNGTTEGRTPDHLIRVLPRSGSETDGCPQMGRERNYRRVKRGHSHSVRHFTLRVPYTHPHNSPRLLLPLGTPFLLTLDTTNLPHTHTDFILMFCHVYSFPTLSKLPLEHRFHTLHI